MKETANKIKELQKPTIVFLTIIYAMMYILWRIFFTLPKNWGKLSLILGAVLIVCELLTIVEALLHFYNAYKVSVPEKPELTDDLFPEVDVFIPTHSESPELLFKTINACQKMSYPNQAKVSIYLCDDGNRIEMEELAERMGIRYFASKEAKHAKAGNLNYGIERTKAPYLVFFDADMIPTRNFLVETIPYFFIPRMIKEKEHWRIRTKDDEAYEGKEIGYLQTRQAFYNPDLFQNNLSLKEEITNDQDYFHREVNVARMNLNGVMFAGTNGIFSRKALSEVGGFSTHSITEDLATSIEVLATQNYQGLAIDKELAHGLAPTTAKGLINQRKRWGQGAAQSIVRFDFLKKKLSLKTKFAFSMTYIYWWTFLRRLVFIMSPMVAALFKLHIADIEFWELIIIVLPWLAFYDYSLKKMSRRRQNAFHSALTDTVLFPYLIIPMITATLKLSNKTFKVTPKIMNDKRNSSFIYALPHIFLLFLSFLSASIYAHDVFIEHNFRAIILLWWVIYNGILLLNAVIFYYGKRESVEDQLMKISVNLPLWMDCEERHIQTERMGESYLTIKNEGRLPDNLRLEIDNGERKFLIEIEKSDMQINNEVVLFEIANLNEEDRRDYFDFLYNRPTTLPQKNSISLIKDLRIIALIIVTFTVSKINTVVTQFAVLFNQKKGMSGEQ